MDWSIGPESPRPRSALLTLTAPRAALLTLLRVALLGGAIAGLFVANGFGLRGPHPILAQGGLVLFAFGTAALGLGRMRGGRLGPRGYGILALGLLALDVVYVGIIGTVLHAPVTSTAAPETSVAFVTAYVVALLVAVSGRRAPTTVLGVLAGTMLLLLAEAGILGVGAAGREAAGDEVAREAHATGGLDLHLWIRAALLAAAAFETSTVLGWLDAEGHRRRATEAVERELRARTAIAGEMAEFVDAVAAAADVGELAEAVLGHLRRHFPTRARAVFLETTGERLAVWEEPGASLDRIAKARRERLAEALREVGSSALLPPIDVRGTGVVARGASDRLRTAVSVPVHGAGRVAGVVFVGDGERHALPVDRLDALAELSRHTGDAMRRLERTRDEQTRRTSLLLSQMREGVLLLAADGTVALANPAGRRLLATLSRAEGEPLSIGDLDTVALTTVPAGGVRRTAATGTGADGRPVRVVAVATGVVDGTRRLGTLLTLTDVTDEEQARARLLEAEKLSAVGQTLASVAHELNNPLAAIVGYADILADAEVPPETAKLLVRIREQATRTSRIVKNLLNVARRRGPERTRVSLNDVVTSVTELFAYEARHHGVTLVCTLDQDCPPLVADRGAIQQVIVNLVQNAMHALRGRDRPGRIELRTRADRTYAYVEVEDDGPGVPASLRAKVFEAFFTTKGPGEGTGLGLAISRSIAKEHGGELTLDDRPPGEGARFTLRLALATSVPLLEPEARTIPDGVPARVLVVDDEAPVRDSLVRTLRRLGAHVDDLDHAAEAERRLFAGTPYDAILLDVRMPGRSGLDMHRALKERRPNLANRVVFMTGDLVNDDVLAAVRASGAPLLEKPFTADELRAALAELSTA